MGFSFAYRNQEAQLHASKLLVLPHLYCVVPSVTWHCLCIAGACLSQYVQEGPLGSGHILKINKPLPYSGQRGARVG